MLSLGIFLISCDAFMKTHTVKFVSDGEVIDEDVIVSGKKVDEPIYHKEGHTLDGWYTSEDEGETFIEKWSFIGYSVQEDLVLYAKWITNTYHVTFHTDGGSSLDDMDVLYGTDLSSLEEPVKYGYVFDGWYLDEIYKARPTDGKMPAEDIELYAKWILGSYQVRYYEVTEKIIDIQTSQTHAMALTNHGRLIAWGLNDRGQLATGDKVNVTVPTDITSNFPLYYYETIKSIKLGSTFGVALTSDSRVMTWGYNIVGQLGDGTTEESLVPHDITPRFGLANNERITQIFAAKQTAYALTNLYRIFAWGHNNLGQIGNGTMENQLTPVDISSTIQTEYDPIPVYNLYTNGSWTFIVLRYNEVYGFGYNSNGQLGIPASSPVLTPIEIDIPEIDDTLLTSLQCVDLHLGERHTLLINTDGDVYASGSNLSRQIGVSTQSQVETFTKLNDYLGLSTDEGARIAGVMDTTSFIITNKERLITWGGASGRIHNPEAFFSIQGVYDVTSRYLTTEEPIIKLMGSSYTLFMLTHSGMLYGLGSGINNLLYHDTEYFVPNAIHMNQYMMDFETELLHTDTIDYQTQIPLISYERDGFTQSNWYYDNQQSQAVEENINMRGNDIDLFTSYDLNRYSITYYSDEQVISHPGFRYFYYKDDDYIHLNRIYKVNYYMNGWGTEEYPYAEEWYIEVKYFDGDLILYATYTYNPHRSLPIR